MLPKNFKPDGLYDLIRLGSDHDGGYLVDPSSIEESKALLALGIGKNWSFEKDFLNKKTVRLNARRIFLINGFLNYVRGIIY